jgi:hypothetical protein
VPALPRLPDDAAPCPRCGTPFVISAGLTPRACRRKACRWARGVEEAGDRTVAGSSSSIRARIRQDLPHVRAFLHDQGTRTASPAISWS